MNILEVRGAQSESLGFDGGFIQAEFAQQLGDRSLDLAVVEIAPREILSGVLSVQMSFGFFAGFTPLHLR